MNCNQHQQFLTREELTHLRKTVHDLQKKLKVLDSYKNRIDELVDKAVQSEVELKIASMDLIAMEQENNNLKMDQEILLEKLSKLRYTNFLFKSLYLLSHIQNISHPSHSNFGFYDNN